MQGNNTRAFVNMDATFSCSKLSNHLHRSKVETSIVETSFQIIRASFPGSKLLKPAIKNIFRQPCARPIQRTILPLNFRLFQHRTIIDLTRAIRDINVHVIRRPFTYRRVPRRRRNNNSRLTSINTSRMFNTLQRMNVVIRTVHKSPGGNIIRRRTSRHTSRRGRSFRPTNRIIAILRRRFRTNGMIRGRKGGRQSNYNRRIIRTRCTSRGVRGTPISGRNSRTGRTGFRGLFGRFSRGRCLAHTHEPP